MNASAWSTADAVDALARKKAMDGLGDLGTCPACGAAPDIELINVSTLAETVYAVGRITCSARCYEKDPAKYLDANAAGPRVERAG